MTDSEEIKSRLDIVEVVREYIQLQQAGGNFRARCPFHQEKSPSFMVSPEKQIFHCFGCGAGGDLFTFVQLIEGLTFPEALRLLAPKAGVKLKKQDNVKTSKRNRLLDILELSRKYYNKVLLESPRAEAARKYLKERGLDEDQILDWQIGYSFDSWDYLLNFLKGKGYNEQEIFQAGMSAKAQVGNKTYDRFRGRIMFPINDVNGSTVAFTARVSPEKEANEKQGKYINSPQTEIYDKSKILFGLDKAKKGIRDQDLAVIVEGQMDVITAYNYGFKNVVASSGTALTTEQIKLLKRFTSNIDLAFDMDDAGQRAADRGIMEASAFDINLSVVEIPGSKDPDECIRNNVKEWREALMNSKPIMQYYFDKIFSGVDLEKVENKRNCAKLFLSKIVILGSKIDHDFWLKKLSQKINIEEFLLRETLTEAIKKSGNENHRQIENKTPLIKKNVLSIEERYSENLLALAFKYMSVFEYLLSHVEIDFIIGESNKNIYKKLITYYNNKREGLANSVKLDYNDFKEWLTIEIKNKDTKTRENQLKSLDKLVLLGDSSFLEFDELKATDETIKIVEKLRRLYFSNRMKIVERKIFESEKANDEEMVKTLLDEFKYLSDELRGIKNV